MNKPVVESHHHPIVIVSFDDDYAAKFIHELESACPTVHVSPLMRTLQASLEALQPSIAIFDLQAIKTEEHSIFDIMASITEGFPHVRKIALGYQNMSAQVISAMKAGACDFLDREASPQEIRETIVRQLRQSRTTQSERTGHAIALVSGRDNEGESQIVANLAAHIASVTPRSDDVLLLDLNLENSRLEIEFNVEITYSVHDAINELLRLDKPILKNVLARHESGLFLLPLATRNRHDEEVSPQELATLLSTLRSFFAIIVINAGCLRNKYCQPYLIPLCDQILVVCPQLIGSVRDALDIFGDDVRASSPDTKYSLVVSHYDPDIDLAANQVGARIGFPLLASVPRASVALANSHNLGQPLVLSAPRSPYGRAIRHLAQKLLPTLISEDAEASPVNGLLGLLEKMKQKVA